MECPVCKSKDFGITEDGGSMYVCLRCIKNKNYDPNYWNRFKKPAVNNIKCHVCQTRSQHMRAKCNFCDKLTCGDFDCIIMEAEYHKCRPCIWRQYFATTN